MEGRITRGETDGIRENIHQLKSELTTLRRSVAPLREAINMFGKADSPLVLDTTGLYLRDLYDHVIQVLDAVEIYRETLTGLQDLYLSELSFRMNKVMQVLTIVATIFIPLTFLVGVYGMNFKHMPELDWPYSYPLLWVIMLLAALVMLRFFHRKKWL
jgi:magnesium transporter